MLGAPSFLSLLPPSASYVRPNVPHAIILTAAIPRSVADSARPCAPALLRTRASFASHPPFLHAISPDLASIACSLHPFVPLVKPTRRSLRGHIATGFDISPIFKRNRFALRAASILINCIGALSVPPFSLATVNLSKVRLAYG